MNINEAISQEVKRSKRDNTTIIRSEKPSLLIIPMLKNLTGVKGFSAYVNANYEELQDKLEEGLGDKKETPQKLVNLGKSVKPEFMEKYYEFTVEDVQKIKPTWYSSTEKGVIDAFRDYGKAGLAAFLLEARSNTELQKSLDTLKLDSNFAQSLVRLGESNNYSFTTQEVNDALTGLKFREPSNDDEGEATRKVIGRIWA